MSKKSESVELTGACLCKAVNIFAVVGKQEFHACHCRMCRKWGGGPLMALNVEPGYKINGEEFVGIYDSSDWAQRGFCKRCGSHLFYRMKSMDFCNMPVGLFVGTESFEFHTQFYVDVKPHSYDFANKTEMLTEAQVMELFGASSSST